MRIPPNLFFALLFAFCVCAASASCSGGDRAEAADVSVARDIDLLRTNAHSRVEEPGIVEPDPARQWGSASIGSWAEYTGSVDGKEPLRFVWSMASKVGLNLTAASTRDRDLRLTMWCPPRSDGATEPMPVDIVLNGLQIERFELVPKPTEYSIHVPASAWREGRNLLELRVHELRSVASGEKLGVALARVRYGEERLVLQDTESSLLELASETGVRYSLEFPQSVSPADTRLAIHAPSKAVGSLLVSWERRDLVTGELTPLGAAGRVPSHELSRGISVPVPDPAHGQLRLTLSWNAQDGESRLRFEVLSVEDAAVPTPPILVVAIDTLAAQRMSLYGYPRSTTPRLEEFASECVVFEQCSSNAPWTLPSFMTLMTGLYPESHLISKERVPGERPQLWDLWQLAETRVTLAETLRARGYRTAAFVDNLWLSDRFRFTQGFESYDASAGRIPLTDSRGGIEHVTKLALPWLRAQPPQQPFFAFLHAFDVHGPYLPPSPWKGRFASAALPEDVRLLPANGLQNVFGVVPDYISEPYMGEQPKEGASLRTDVLSNAYDEGVLAMDARLGEFLDVLAAEGILDRCILVVTSDHGETSQGHDYYYGHGVLFQDVLHVPLLIRLPRGEHGGLRVQDPVQLADLYPTLVELIGGATQARSLHGRSLVPLLRGERAAAHPNFSGAGVMRQHSLRWENWKLVTMEPGRDTSVELMLSWPGLDRGWLEVHAPELLEGGLTATKFDAIVARAGGVGPLRARLLAELESKVERKLFDIASDPAETRDLAEERPEIVAKLEALLAEERAKVAEARLHAKPNDAPPAFSAEELLELGKIGYAEAK